MLPEHDQRFRRIMAEYIERPGGDYGELLRRGQVYSPDSVDLEQWRAEIRAQARKDNIRVTTVGDPDRQTAFAALRPRMSSAEEMAIMRRELDRAAHFRSLAAAGARLGHTVGPWLRHHDETIDETIAFCTAYEARLYATYENPDAAVSDGEALMHPCPWP